MEKLRKGADGFQLKLFALFVMTLDHIYYFLPGMPLWLTCAGRLAAPIFLFLCVEGFGYTRSRPKYLLRMYGFSIGMRLASMIVVQALPRQDGATIMNDMFSTMFVVCWCIAGLDILTGRGNSRRKRLLGAGMLLGMLAATAVVFAFLVIPELPRFGMRVFYLLLPNPMTCEGSYMWVILGIAFYYVRASRWKTVLVMAAFSGLHFALVQLDLETAALIFCMLAAAVPLALYNGKPGKHRCKWLFYAYYPAHVYVFYLIGWALQGG